MIRKIRCIECPKGCFLSVDIEDFKVVSIKGNECPKGEKHAISEVENPVRILTSAVLSQGLDLKMIPIRTDHIIVKAANTACAAKNIVEATSAPTPPVCAYFGTLVAKSTF